MLKFIASFFASKAIRPSVSNRTSTAMRARTAGLVSAATVTPSGNPASATRAINALGLQLLGKGTAAGDNALLSPYSIQSALAMTFAGAAGNTRAEMAQVLHYPGDEAELHQSFAALRKALEQPGQAAEHARMRERGRDPFTLTVANCLFGQMDYDFREPFLGLLEQAYEAPFQPLDFSQNPSKAAQHINRWVEKQTCARIRDLIPPGALDTLTRLVLVNAIYLKVPWAMPFAEELTQPRPFHVRGGKPKRVPTMVHESCFGYSCRAGFRAVTLPYVGRDLQFLVLLPEEVNGLAKLEAEVTPELLAACANAKATELILHLPKFKIEPPLFALSGVLKALGMRSAFDQPPGSADFDRMAPRKPGDYLYLSEVFHKAWLDLDEKGTEAAATTMVVAQKSGGGPPKEPQPIEVRVDHPFLFAVQHPPSGACLFLGRVTDPGDRFPE